MWWRYRAFTRPTQLHLPLRWTIMPVGFMDMIKGFVNYKDRKKRRVSKEGENEGDGYQGESGVNYKYLMGFADGTRPPYPPWWDCDKVLLPLHIPGVDHWILVVLDLCLFDVIGYDSLPNLCVDERTELVKELGRYIVHYLDAIRYRSKLGDGRKKPFKDTCQLRLELLKDVPVQNSGLGDCGVWVCRNMETIAYNQDYRMSGDTGSFALEYRQRMMQTFFSSRFDWQPLPPSPPPPPPEPKTPPAP